MYYGLMRNHDCFYRCTHKGNDMTEKELKKLNRYQLLELLVMQTERADSLEKKVEELQARLDDRELRFARLGSLAEAALCVSEVFESAQKAADLYLEAAKKQADELVEQSRSRMEEEQSCRAAVGKDQQAGGKRKSNEKGNAKGAGASKTRHTKK